MTPRQARRERREAERKAKKLEFKRTRQASGACLSAMENHQPSAPPLPGIAEEFLEIQPRWNPDSAGQPSCAWSPSQTHSDEFAKPQRTALPGSCPASEFPREEQIRNNALADRIALKAGLPIPPPGPTPGPFSSLEEMRAYYPAKRNPADDDGHARPAPAAKPINPVPEIGFVSQKRAEANRANAKLSTGPRSTIGKFNSSRNSTKHGLASGQLIIPGEDPIEFESLLTDLLNDRQPVGDTEELLVTEMAQSHWLAQRAIRLQNGCFTENGVDEKSLSLFLRYFTTHNGAFHKALADLQRLQKERKKAERGFVSQTATSTAPTDGFVSQKRASAGGEGEFARQNDPSTELKAGFVSQTEPAEPSKRSQPAKQAA